MQLSLDRREIRLSHALGEFPHEMVELPVGDAWCTYTDGRASWVAERKTATVDGTYIAYKMLTSALAINNKFVSC